MPFISTQVGCIYAFQWDGRVLAEDFAASRPQIEAAVRSTNQKVYHLVFMPAGLEQPTAEVRAIAIKETEHSLSLCAAMDLVILGEGVMMSLQRTMVRGMVMLLPRFRHNVWLHSTAREALTRIAGETALDVESTLTTLRGKGFSVGA